MVKEEPRKKGSGFWRVVRWLILVVFVIFFGVAIGAFLYYRSITSSPQYSLALLVDAARRGDVNTIESLVDSDAVVDSFIPQITEEAIGLYGRGLPPKIAPEISKLIKPALPVIKNRVRDELPEVIRERVADYQQIPFWLFVFGADRALNIKVEGDLAKVSTKLVDHPPEIQMKRDGNLWRIVAVSDRDFAKKIAGKIGQQILAAVNEGRLEEISEQFGVKNLDDVLDKAEEIFR